MVLAARDRKILRALGRHRYLTTDLIELVFFPTTRSDGRASTAAYDRLRQLWLWGNVERVQIPITRVGGGRRSVLYALGTRGLRFLASEARPSDHPVPRRRSEGTSELVVARRLVASALWANLVALARTTPVHLRRWESAGVLRARRDRAEAADPNRGLPVPPDAVFELATTEFSIRKPLPRPNGWASTTRDTRFCTTMAGVHR